jgi:hypothetical protein
MAEGLDIQALVETYVPLAFSLAGTAKTPAVLHLKKTPAYNYTTDVTTQSGGQDVSLEGIFYKSKQAQGANLTERETLFALDGADAPDGIDEADTLTVVETGKVWQIDDVEYIQRGVMYILHLRR